MIQRSFRGFFFYEGADALSSAIGVCDTDFVSCLDQFSCKRPTVGFQRVAEIARGHVQLRRHRLDGGNAVLVF